MRAFVFRSLFILMLPLLSYQHKVEEVFDLDNEKYVNFLAAVHHSATFSYFTVIKVKNINTGVVKEICTKGNFVAGALHMEMNIDYDTNGQQKVFDFIKLKTDRYFEFKNKAALENISFVDYKTELVNTIQAKYNFDKTIEVIKRDKAFSIRLSNDEMKAFAHVLFNKGYLTGEDNCWGGALEYVDRSKVIK